MPRIGTCSVCERENITVKKNRISGFLWCARCIINSRKEECVHCGKVKPVSARADSGGSVCGSCNRARKVKASCSQCGDIAVLQRSRRDGKAVCNNCVRKKASFQCRVCQKEICGYPTRRQEREPICYSCVTGTECFQCSVCEQEKKGYPASVTEDGSICENCYSKHLRSGKCDLCLRTRPILSMVGGISQCGTCYKRNRPRAHCALCGSSRRIQSTFEGKPVCTTCYRKHLAPRDSCASCGEFRPVAKRIGNSGLALCDVCYQRTKGLKLHGKCKTCGNEGPIEIFNDDGDGFCLGCSRHVSGEYEPCRDCQLNRVVRARDRDGCPICASCLRI